MDWLNDPNAWVGLLTLTCSSSSSHRPHHFTRSRRKATKAQRMDACWPARRVCKRLLLFMSSADLRDAALSRVCPPVGTRSHLRFGGLFLIGKRPRDQQQSRERSRARLLETGESSFGCVITRQLIDIVFSLDSVDHAVVMAGVSSWSRHTSSPSRSCHGSGPSATSSTGTRR